MPFTPHPSQDVPPGGTLLITGVSGMIAIHIADEALRAGFRVLGTVRSPSKGAFATSLLAANPHAHNFSYTVIPDMAAPRAFHAAMQGVSAAIHCASIVSFSGIISEVITPTVRGTVNVLEAAMAHRDTVKSVVLTSTSGAASGPRPGVRFHIGRDTWNEEAVRVVRDTPPEKQREMGFEWGYVVYVVSKIEAERAAWEFVEKEKPPFRVNVTNPAMNWGKVMGSMGISGGQVLSVLDGRVPPIPSVYMADTIDDARIHIAAAVDGRVRGERIFVCDEPFNWRLVIETMRKVLPDAELPPTDPKEPLDISTVDNELGAELLRTWWGQKGYKGLEQTVRETVEITNLPFSVATAFHPVTSTPLELLPVELFLLFPDDDDPDPDV
ncbi:NAD(P)-binding protein [Podospora aff. communis PSN243]|uniref:NAD(P)-binding protein n=1 Tax=Podospora aff. communis PSN243 TaxID=3040156 RepID=A0AAV9GIT1_9PEZI|nr:NAD(P)-binding protein [Podospora aff. communis PSN243]